MPSLMMAGNNYLVPIFRMVLDNHFDLGYRQRVIEEQRMLTTEKLPNGLIKVTDRQAGWAALYTPQGEYRGGAVDTRAYRMAAKQHTN